MGLKLLYRLNLAGGRYGADKILAIYTCYTHLNQIAREGFDSKDGQYGEYEHYAQKDERAGSTCLCACHLISVSI